MRTGERPIPRTISHIHPCWIFSSPIPKAVGMDCMDIFVGRLRAHPPTSSKPEGNHTWDILEWEVETQPNSIWKKRALWVSCGRDLPSGREGAASRTPAARNGSHLSVGSFHMCGVTTGLLHTLPSWSPKKMTGRIPKGFEGKVCGR